MSTMVFTVCCEPKNNFITDGSDGEGLQHIIKIPLFLFFRLTVCMLLHYFIISLVGDPKNSISSPPETFEIKFNSI